MRLRMSKLRFRLATWRSGDLAIWRLATQAAIYLAKGFETSCAPTSRPSRRASPIPSLSSGGVFDWDQAQVRFDELNALVEAPNFWNDPEKAQKLMRERNKLASAIDNIKSLERDLADTLELAELAEAEGEAGMLDEAH